MSALSRSAPLRFAPFRLAPLRFARLRFAWERASVLCCCTTKFRRIQRCMGQVHTPKFRPIGDAQKVCIREGLHRRNLRYGPGFPYRIGSRTFQVRTWLEIRSVIIQHLARRIQLIDDHSATPPGFFTYDRVDSVTVVASPAPSVPAVGMNSYCIRGWASYLGKGVACLC